MQRRFYPNWSYDAISADRINTPYLTNPIIKEKSDMRPNRWFWIGMGICEGIGILLTYITYWGG